MLAEAPMLDDWRYVASKLGARLTGRVAEHPRLRGGAIVTSPVWVIDPNESWCRTTSRYYRLGNRLDLEDALPFEMFAGELDGELR